MRKPAVPTAAIVRTPCRFASSTMPAIAAIVRSSAVSTIAPPCASPSPRRVSSARSTTVRQRPAGVALADVKLDRVGADVDHRVTHGLIADRVGKTCLDDS